MWWGAGGRRILIHLSRPDTFYAFYAERIELRVRNGGHNIPEAVVLRRFDRSLPNFFRFYQPLADSWTIFDNSEDIPKMIAFEEAGKLEVLDPDMFHDLQKYRGKQ